MADLKDAIEELHLELCKSRMSLSRFANLLERISATDLKQLSQEELMAGFKSHRDMANYAVLLLVQTMESLNLEKPDLQNVREALSLGVQAIQLQMAALSQAGDAGFKISVKRESNRGRTAADARHSKAGGSRSKAQAMRDLWAKGKYSSSDICAEQECGSLGMSFSAARKALRGTPTPA